MSARAWAFAALALAMALAFAWGVRRRLARVEEVEAFGAPAPVEGAAVLSRE